ncbi:TonB-dependent receptor plug domain-containing protein [Marinobacter halotolerans]|uniref:TonB-dependent receptor plug domain-containing protein n=1 Tax=Marinobacter halotolerans TaxID=1569211 RepID=UPI001247CA64|nr:TonB-dependent receptor [Marinobacter halotolerans]
MAFTTDRRAKTQKTYPIRPPLPLSPRLFAFAAGLTLAAVPAYGAEPGNTDSDGGFYGFSDSLPEVLTTTRLRQPKTRVPGSTTVIEGDMIRDLGIMHLVEVFRLVPGMVVGHVGSSTPVTTYHGTVHYEQRRMQVLVDGRTAHRATLSDMDWQTMPVPLELIERIEVSRGPNSAAYGINAFLGTINIITRDPADTVGAEVRAVRGSRQYIRTFASIGDASQDYDWRLAFEKRQFEGFDYQLVDDPVTDEIIRVPFNDGHDINVLNYDSRLTVSPAFNAEFRAGVVDGENEEDVNKSGELGATANPDIDVRDYYLQTRLNFTPSEQHFYHLQFSFENFKRRQSWPISIPESAVNCLRNGTLVFWRENRDVCFAEPAPGATPLTADVNAHSEDSRLEFELQDTIIFNRDLKLVTGAGYRQDIYRSETYFNGRGSNYQSRVFGNVEYTPVRWLTLNGGGNWERTTTTDESYFSPRVAANFVFTPNHALRFVYSKAVRTPDGFEQNPDYGFTLRNVEPAQYSDFEGYRVENTDVWDNPSLVTLGRELEEERITSKEISYFGQFPAGAALFTLEVRAFRDQLRDMISGIIQFDDWTIDNNVDLNQKGFEVEASMEYPGTTLRTSYGYLDQDGSYNGPQIFDDDGNVDAGEKQYNVDLLGRLSVRHSGSVALIQDLTAGFLGSAAFYWADEFERGTHSERLDLRLAKKIFQPNYTAEIALTMQHWVNEQPDLSADNNIKHQNQFFIEAGVRF